MNILSFLVIVCAYKKDKLEDKECNVNVDKIKKNSGKTNAWQN